MKHIDSYIEEKRDTKIFLENEKAMVYATR